MLTSCELTIPWASYISNNKCFHFPSQTNNYCWSDLGSENTHRPPEHFLSKDRPVTSQSQYTMCMLSPFIEWAFHGLRQVFVSFVTWLTWSFLPKSLIASGHTITLLLSSGSPHNKNNKSSTPYPQENFHQTHKILMVKAFWNWLLKVYESKTWLYILILWWL